MPRSGRRPGRARRRGVTATPDSCRGKAGMTSRVSQKVAVSVVYVAAMFMTIMDSTIVNVALPTIGRDFGGAVDLGGQRVDLLPGEPAVFISVSGWLGDRFGGKRVLLTAIAVFTVASALCGRPVAGRAGCLPRAAGRRRRDDGPGRAGHAVPCLSPGRADPRVEHPDRADHARPALGPVIGGLPVTDCPGDGFLRERAAGDTHPRLRRAIPRRRNALRPGPFDMLGFALAGPAWGCRCTAYRRGRSGTGARASCRPPLPPGRSCSGAGVRRAAEAQPLIHLRLLGNRLFRSSNGVMLLASASFIGTLYVVALFFQDGRGCPRSARG